MDRRQVDLNRLVWLGLGAGSKGVVSGVVTGWVGEEVGITPDIATAFIGFMIANYGGERVGTFGEGMLIASIGQIIKTPIEKLFEKFKPTPGEEKVTGEQAAGSQKVAVSPEDAYITAKYGISLS